MLDLYLKHVQACIRRGSMKVVGAMRLRYDDDCELGTEIQVGTEKKRLIDTVPR